jgi:hypothetical protein
MTQKIVTHNFSINNIEGGRFVRMMCSLLLFPVIYIGVNSLLIEERK